MRYLVLALIGLISGFGSSKFRVSEVKRATDGEIKKFAGDTTECPIKECIKSEEDSERIVFSSKFKKTDGLKG